MRTVVYVDGFNLYYGALKGSAWKWLDLVALFRNALQSHHEILTVKYFTARVSGTSADPSKPQRQDVYLRALRHYRPEVVRIGREGDPRSVLKTSRVLGFVVASITSARSVAARGEAPRPVERYHG